MDKSNVYTGGGDKGKTSLVSGTRVSKGDDRLELYGGMDGLNSYIGLMIATLAKNEKFNGDQELISMIQNKLFDIGSLLACESSLHEQYKLPTITDEHIKVLENAIDKYDAIAGKITYFIIPGGSFESAACHVCRTECRTLERKLVRYNIDNDGEIKTEIMTFVNRLSDFFFVFARYINCVLEVKEYKWEKC